jgi:hypothetical protein
MSAITLVQLSLTVEPPVGIYVGDCQSHPLNPQKKEAQHEAIL